jgi:hypothetical protein
MEETSLILGEEDYDKITLCSCGELIYGEIINEFCDICNQIERACLKCDRFMLTIYIKNGLCWDCIQDEEKNENEHLKCNFCGKFSSTPVCWDCEKKPEQKLNIRLKNCDHCLAKVSIVYGEDGQTAVKGLCYLCWCENKDEAKKKCSQCGKYTKTKHNINNKYGLCFTCFDSESIKNKCSDCGKEVNTTYKKTGIDGLLCYTCWGKEKYSLEDVSIYDPVISKEIIENKRDNEKNVFIEVTPVDILTKKERSKLVNYINQKTKTGNKILYFNSSKFHVECSYENKNTYMQIIEEWNMNNGSIVRFKVLYN